MLGQPTAKRRCPTCRYATVDWDPATAQPLRRDQATATEAEVEFAELKAQKRLHLIGGCTFLGGFGFDDRLTPRARVDLHFTATEIWVTAARRGLVLQRCAYANAEEIEVSGEARRTGGGFIGGGFGAAGAVEGMAIAAVLNSLTSRTDVRTVIRLREREAELHFFTDQATPAQLEIPLSEVRSLIKRTAHVNAQVQPAESSLASKLIGLGEMRDRGLLTDVEFAAAKADLLNRG